jgi:hypothetical protein
MTIKIYSNEKEMFYNMDKGIQIITPKFKHDKMVDYNITYNWDGDNVYKITNRLNNLVDVFYLLQFYNCDFNISIFKTLELKDIDRSYNQYIFLTSIETKSIAYQKINDNYYLDERYYDGIPKQIRDIILTNVFNYRNDKLINTNKGE